MKQDVPRVENGERAKLRHEFVGMMFAVAIGEVGLQTAALVRANHVAYFLPAYSHLFLATFVIATSWIGWSISVAPGNREDVKGIFQWEFLVLLLDVSLVIMYFILVRTIHFSDASIFPTIDPASAVAFWILMVFCFYLVWDIVTKVATYRGWSEGSWLRKNGWRMAPTLACLLFAWWIWSQVGMADRVHLLSADFALLCLVLLFRALKEFVSATGLKETVLGFVSAICACGLIYGVLATRNAWPLPLPYSAFRDLSATKPV